MNTALSEVCMIWLHIPGLGSYMSSIADLPGLCQPALTGATFDGGAHCQRLGNEGSGQSLLHSEYSCSFMHGYKPSEGTPMCTSLAQLQADSLKPEVPEERKALLRHVGAQPGTGSRAFSHHYIRLRCNYERTI